MNKNDIIDLRVTDFHPKFYKVQFNIATEHGEITVNPIMWKSGHQMNWNYNFVKFDNLQTDSLFKGLVLAQVLNKIADGDVIIGKKMKDAVEA
jgi:hypothetical protein